MAFSPAPSCHISPKVDSVPRRGTGYCRESIAQTHRLAWVETCLWVDVRSRLAGDVGWQSLSALTRA